VAKYIEWYLTEAESQLQGRLRRDRLHEVLSETEAHLRDTAEDMTSHGMSEQDAELAAIERFGRVSTFVGYVCKARYQKLAIRLLFIGSLAVTAMASITFLLWVSTRSRGYSSTQASLLGLAAATCLLLAGSSLTGRRRIWPVVIGGLVGCVAGFAIAWPLGAHYETSRQLQFANAYDRAFERLQNDIDQMNRGRVAFQTGNAALIKEFTRIYADRAPENSRVDSSTTAYLIPREANPQFFNKGRAELFNSYYTGQMTVAYPEFFDRALKLESARYLWQRNTPGAIELALAYQADATSQAKIFHSKVSGENLWILGATAGLGCSLVGVFSLVAALLLHLLIARLTTSSRRSYLRRKLA
jgi:hypothetical protein